MAQTLANIIVKPCTITWNEVELGYTQGDVEISMEEQGVDITAHQSGSEVLDHIRTGSNVEVTLTVQETSMAQLQTLFEVAGGAHTPTSGTEASGWGRSQRFSGQLADAQLLVLKPVGASDNSENISFWKAYPMVNSMVISAENPRAVEVTFKCFDDTTKESAVSKFLIGDQTQDFTP